MSLEVSSARYIKARTVSVDGKAWQMKAIGAAEELTLSQKQRRVLFIEDKIKKGTATDDDLNLCDQLERDLYDAFAGIFKDNTKDNAEVNAWLTSTPMAVVVQIVEDIKKQVQETDAAKAEPTPEKAITDGAQPAA